MTEQEITEILNKQKKFYASGTTLPRAYREAALLRLRECVVRNTEAIEDALYKDLMKSRTEGFMCEVGLALSELSYILKHLKKFMRNRKVTSPITNFPSKSIVKPVPYGTVLIMSPWNYPFLLTIDPLIDAIAAGNTCIIKPSAYSPATSEIINSIISESFDPEYVAVINGGRAENTCLLKQQFDYIFFTGSQSVGKEVLRQAAEHLTPATLELGGKSPCIIDEAADIKLAARRVVFGKYINCGQTCVAPDYIYCHESIRDQFIEEVKKQIAIQYTETPLTNPAYGKIISDKHYKRVCGLINTDKVVFGGHTDDNSLRIEPTVMSNITWDDAVMQEEIFGPIMPILSYSSLTELISFLNTKMHPLAGYFFSNDKKKARYFMEHLSFGGGCVNDTIVHLATSYMGFGGVGESGMGSYHGKTGFDTFSHKKSIAIRGLHPDLSVRYQPLTSDKRKLAKKLLK